MTVTIPQRRGRPLAQDRDEKRAAILAAAARLFAERGYDATPMASVAGACGVSKALLYHYYVSKDALLFDILHQHLVALIEAVEAVPNAPSPEARLAELCVALLTAYEDADCEHQVQIRDLDRLPPDRQEELKALERRLVAVFAEAIAALAPGEALAPGLLKPVTMSLFGMLNWNYLWFRPDGPMSRQEYARLAAQMVAAGVERVARERVREGKG